MLNNIYAIIKLKLKWRNELIPEHLNMTKNINKNILKHCENLCCFIDLMKTEIYVTILCKLLTFYVI